MAKLSSINKNNKRIKLSDLYFKKRQKLKKIVMDKKISLEDIKANLPFKSEREGNLFRKWLYENKPLKSKQMDIDIEGSYDNGFILDAYNLYGQEYEESKREY